MNHVKKGACSIWASLLWPWIRFALIFFLTILAIFSITWGYLFWGWENEQLTIKKIGESHISEIVAVPLGGETGKWMKSNLGQFFFVLDRIGAIVFNDTTRDAQMSYMSEFNNLTCVNLEGALITDLGLKSIVKKSDLTVINFTGTQITDAGLEYLQECKGLRWLILDSTKITDIGLFNLQKVKTLEVLYLKKTKITDAGLKSIEKLDKLHSLNINDTQITDAGLIHLQECKDLHWIDLVNTKISDVGLEHLRKLKGFNKLRLKVTNTKVTDTAIKKMQDKYPELIIIK